MDKKENKLQARIDRTAEKLAALKAQQQAREARERARRNSEARAMRNRALVLLGVALERAAVDAPERINSFRSILEKYLTRENERAVARDFLDTLSRAAPTQPDMTSSQNTVSHQ